MYQLFRGLAYIHSTGVCHRDLKPQVNYNYFNYLYNKKRRFFQNILVDQDSAVLKVCDFGSAKHLVKGEVNVSYICSRYYRAPELIFGATNYTQTVGKQLFGTEKYS